MADTAILVIDGSRILAELNHQYERNRYEWEIQCSAVKARFKQKTSRTTKNGKVYESTNWYEEQPGGGLKSVGKEEPDYSKYYSPEPKPVYSFGFNEYDGHVILEEKDYKANQALFRDCLAFRLEECVNFSHPLYKNPQKAIDSVRKAGVSSARSPGKVGQKRDPVCFGDDERCLGDGDCDNCEHNDECPVPVEYEGEE